MNTSHDIAQQNTPPITVLTSNPTFYNVVFEQDMDYHELQKIARDTGIDEGVMNDMFLTIAVRRVDAEKYLAAFSAYTKKTWTLDNVRVALLPTLADVCKKHELNVNALCLQLDKVESLPFCCFDMMLEGTPVSAEHAIIVLDVVSSQAEQHYTLENVDIVLQQEN